MLASLSAVLLLMVTAQAAPPVRPAARLTITQRALVPVCVDHSRVTPSQRRWSLGAAPFTITVTMKHAPRTGIANAAPGHATVTFTPEPGHRYEVEVRAPSTAFSRRVFAQGAWTPVVRDRTTDRIVSTDPVWTDGSCGDSGER